MSFNLSLINLIGDAYAPKRAEKILRKFRRTNVNVLREHFLFSIFNPKFDYAETHMIDEQGLYANVNEVS